jgi:hypothetical protein
MRIFAMNLLPYETTFLFIFCVKIYEFLAGVFYPAVARFSVPAVRFSFLISV